MSCSYFRPNRMRRSRRRSSPRPRWRTRAIFCAFVLAHSPALTWHSRKCPSTAADDARADRGDGDAKRHADCRRARRHHGNRRAEEIARAGAQSLAELLQRQPGVEIFQNGGPGSVSSALLRGANRGQTLVLIDGVRVASSSAGATSFEAIPLDQIDHIEILRGPASSLYGRTRSAVSFRLFTRRGDGAPSGNAARALETRGPGTVKGGVGGTSGPVQLPHRPPPRRAAGSTRLRTRRIFSTAPIVTGTANQSVSANVGLTVAPGHDLTVQFFQKPPRRQFDGGSTLDERTITSAESWQVASRNRLASFWVSRLSAADGIDDSRTQSDFGSVFKTRSGNTRGKTNLRCRQAR